MRIIAEPGRYIAAPAAVAVSSVMGRALRDGRWWYYLDDGAVRELQRSDVRSCDLSDRGSCAGRAHLSLGARRTDLRQHRRHQRAHRTAETQEGRSHRRPRRWAPTPGPLPPNSTSFPAPRCWPSIAAGCAREGASGTSSDLEPPAGAQSGQLLAGSRRRPGSWAPRTWAQAQRLRAGQASGTAQPAHAGVDRNRVLSQATPTFPMHSRPFKYCCAIIATASSTPSIRRCSTTLLRCGAAPGRRSRFLA